MDEASVDARVRPCLTDCVTGFELPARGDELDMQMQLVIDRASIPGRHREPRLAEQLESVARTGVATSHGQVVAWRDRDGPAVLLVHGWRDSARLWDPLMLELRARGRPFVALDLPGHGFSEGERCLLPEVIDAVSAVAVELGPVDALVAHSFASGGATRAVVEGVPARRIVLIAPPLSYRDPDKATRSSMDAGHQRWRRIAGDLGFESSVGELALHTYLARLGGARAAWNLENGVADLDAEVLLVASVDDERFDTESARRFAADRGNVTFAQLVGLDHRASARDPAAVKVIAEFVTFGESVRV